MGWRVLQECGFIVHAPHEVDACPIIDTPAAFAWVDSDLAAILRPGKHTRQYCPRVVGLALRAQRQLVPPIHEDTARARIGERLHWAVAELLLDLDDLFDVVGARSLAQAEKVLALLICLH